MDAPSRRRRYGVYQRIDQCPSDAHTATRRRRLCETCRRGKREQIAVYQAKPTQHVRVKPPKRKMILTCARFVRLRRLRRPTGPQRAARVLTL